VTKGLTGVAVAAPYTIVTNDVSRDPRYLTAFETTGSEMIGRSVPEVMHDNRSVVQRLPRELAKKRATSRPRVFVVGLFPAAAICPPGGSA
jgi:hypothetical protein